MNGILCIERNLILGNSIECVKRMLALSNRIVCVEKRLVHCDGIGVATGEIHC